MSNNGIYHFFWKRTLLSQWAKTPFIESNGTTHEDSVAFLTAEHYMMYKKAELFNDIDSMNFILETSSPKEAKRLGSLVKNFNQKVWDRYKFNIVYSGNVLKFQQNKNAYNELISTGDKIIVEACPYDRICGIGMEENDPNILNTILWGENNLGKALMEVRNFLNAKKHIG